MKTIEDWTFLTRLDIFLSMIFTRDGLGNFVGIRQALWYANHPEWWGMRAKK